MARSATPPRPRSWIRRRSRAGLVAALLLLAPAGVVMLAIETEPRVAEAAPPDAASAARVRALAERLRDFVEPGEAPPVPLSASEAEINAALASLSRLRPGFAGRVTVGDDHVDGMVSAGGPLLPGGVWINLSASVTETPQGTELTSLRVGRLPLPPALVMPALRFLADRELGPGAGAAAMDALAGLRIDAPEVSLAAAAGELTGGGRLDRLKARLRAMASGSTSSDRVVAHLRALHDAARAPDFADAERSLLPFLRQALGGLSSGTADDPEAEMRAAIFALALYCGDARFGLAIGVWVPERMQGRRSRCARATLEGRNDLVRHFVLSAGIHAASTDGAVAGLGELKELLDSNPDGTGFSFDDMAANLAGARFATRLMSAEPQDWPGIIGAIHGEADILPAIDDLPSGLAAADFEAAYGDIDSPAYRALLAEIETRIGALAIHRGG